VEVVIDDIVVVEEGTEEVAEEVAFALADLVAEVFAVALVVDDFAAGLALETPNCVESC
jgi:hypothetical protein